MFASKKVFSATKQSTFIWLHTQFKGYDPPGNNYIALGTRSKEDGTETKAATTTTSSLASQLQAKQILTSSSTGNLVALASANSASTATTTNVLTASSSSASLSTETTTKSSVKMSSHGSSSNLSAFAANSNVSNNLSVLGA